MTDRPAPDTIATAQIVGDRDYQEDTLAVHVLKTGMRTGELLLVLASTKVLVQAE